MSDSTSPKLWCEQPAEQDWNRALPIGCGKLGAMVFGNVVAERIQLNEDSIWSGGPRDRNNPDTRKALPEIRRLFNEGRLAAAHALVNDSMAGLPDSMRCYEPLADLLIQFDHPGVKTELSAEDMACADSYVVPRFNRGLLTSYRRELDLSTATVSVDYILNGNRFHRRHIASAVENAIILRFEAETPGTLSLRLRMERGPRESYSSRFADTIRRTEESGLLLAGATGGQEGIRFASCLRAAPEGGTLKIVGETLTITGADAVTFVVAAGTSFREADPAGYAVERAAAALKRGWPALFKEHCDDFRRYFDRADLRLGHANDKTDLLPTDQRLSLVREGSATPSLAALYFHFGRYLLISSSRPGSLPANAQGIWNQDFWPSWGAKYTTNINVEMNYWAAEPANLAECHEPLFDLVHRMAENGRHTAQVMYGCRGFVAHHNTDIWADTCPTDRNLAASYWLLGGAWLALHLWEHYAFSGDRAFLKKAYPVLREASLFFLDFLIEDAKGRLVVSPSVSPENIYRLPNGEFGVLGNGCSMDAQILTMLFRFTRDASRVLETDGELRQELAVALEKLPPLSIGRNGQLMEWIEDYDEVDPEHRHVAHAFAIHPGDLISPRRTPQLAQALEKTLVKRGDEGTGWCMAWKACFWARLGKGNRAYELLLNLLQPVESKPLLSKDLSYTGGGSFPNLLCAHPPFQIDGNFGGTAAIIEMLLQSHETEKDAETDGELPVIHVLPAIPEAWAEGSFRGLRARGGFEVDAAWKEGRLVSGRIISRQGGSFFLLYRNRLRRIALSPGKEFSLADID